MAALNIEAIRAEVRALDYVRGTPAEVAAWREADEDSRHNHVIEGIRFEPDEDALFAMLLDERVPPELMTQIVRKLLDVPAADPNLAITPLAGAH
ncbi:hypothetical protein [Sphingomonas aerophila]|uniref:Type VI protein secretion system component VasK n=1 Tax=Sphingomonas aerophila TaxID=1344948 RepID=A0A7W9EW11_9SPHN|nr:hypothetical protein [Sphingomonas aerophila]MBB5716811.1 type VI protein secretion system component VasK [Sphingomonas aerophila]